MTGIDETESNLDVASEKKSRLQPGLKRTVARWFLRHPFFATTASAAALATIWIVAWGLVLICLAYVTKSQTTAYVFIAGLLLSTVAEAVIRIAETSPLIERYSMGTLNKSIRDMGWGWALCIFVTGILAASLVPQILSLPDAESFILMPPPAGDQALLQMLSQWRIQFIESPVMIISVIFCWLLRTVIYKRSHKTEHWSDTKEKYQKLGS